ncbi:hypothetical protein HDU96_001156 [Phlyctochytrium bullatum]|nr:hypothetical protein HDU96_001156 [Phlyctochytrium bullatum]
MHLSTVSLLALALAASTAALPQSTTPRQLTPGKVVQIIDPTSFCLLLPAKPGITIGESEGSAVSKCTGNAGTLGAQRIPAGAVRSAHVVKTPSIIQVTGRIDLVGALQVNPRDGGGQYDDASWGIEPLSACQGYDRYVEIVGGDVYCLRCCNFPPGTDLKAKDYDKNSPLIKGNYGPGFDYKEQPDLPASSSG